MPEETLAGKLAGFACRLSYEDLSRDQVEKIKMFFLDWLGSAVAGRSETAVRMVLEVVRDLAGNPEATVMADGSQTNCLLAALANGASSHVVEMDDLHRESILHPAAAIIPAVLAAAEKAGASGRETIAGLAAGYEVGIRVALAAGPEHYRYWHTTATCGTFGAAAGAGRVMGLREDRLVWALGSAGTQAAGLWEFLAENAMSKQLHTGKAAFNGLLACLLAEKGFTGARGILEGQKGFFRATAPEFDPGKCLEGLGSGYVFERNSLKYHASCGHTHSAIDSVLKATGGRAMAPADIWQVDVYVYRQALDLLDSVEAATPHGAKFNFPFCIATALRHGRVGLGDFSARRLADPEIRLLMQKVRLHEDPELSRAYPHRWPARVEVHTSEGKTLRGACEFPKGDPENPLTQEELLGKFGDLTAGLISDSGARALAKRVMDLENIPRVSLVFEDHVLQDGIPSQENS